jgi:pimeloyl-ACP methyl ester carboxylesterase
MPTVFVNGIHIYYEIHGTGVPLVLIGGLASDLTYYEGIIRQLSHKYQVIAFDNRGAGRTDKPDIPYSIEMMADDTAGLLAALGIKYANVLGISMGGRIAVELTLQHPKQVKSLILVSTIVKRMPMTWSHRMLDVFFKLPFLRTAGRRYPAPSYAASRQREATRNYDATDRLREIHVPTLILHGKNDRLASCALAEEMHARIQGSKMLVFKGAHHFLFVRQEQFVAAVVDFLDAQTDD